jgi:hypothetical protein
MNIFKKIALYTFVLVLSSSLSANSNFNTDESVLFVPKVDVNGEPTFKNVRLKLDFSNNTFKILGTPADYPSTLSDSVIQSETNIVEQVTTGLRGCVKSSNDVICYFLVTSDEKNRDVRVLASSSFLVDDLNNKYTADKVEGGEEDSRIVITNFLVKGEPVLHKLYFSGVSDLASKINVLTIDINAESRDETGAIFKEIEL